MTNDPEPTIVMRLVIVPAVWADVQEFVERHHRHHSKPVGMKFIIGLADGDEIVGVATTALTNAPRAAPPGQYGVTLNPIR